MCLILWDMNVCEKGLLVVGATGNIRNILKIITIKYHKLFEWCLLFFLLLSSCHVLSLCLFLLCFQNVVTNARRPPSYLKHRSVSIWIIHAVGTIIFLNILLEMILRQGWRRRYWYWDRLVFLFITFREMLCFKLKSLFLHNFISPLPFDTPPLKLILTSPRGLIRSFTGILYYRWFLWALKISFGESFPY